MTINKNKYRGKGLTKTIKHKNKSDRAKERNTLKAFEQGIIDESDVELRINVQNKNKVLSDWQ